MFRTFSFTSFFRSAPWWVALLWCYCCVPLWAAEATDTTTRLIPVQQDTLSTAAFTPFAQKLQLQVDGTSFFINNEFGGEIAKGYTLPGFWLQPRLTYAPSSNVNLELGLHALVYHGANKYPNYAYHDLALWKGSQYQEGAHLLPFFRATIALARQQRLVLGGLYGEAQHQLLTPMYNTELLFSADPEKGLQYLLATPHYHLDIWIDWESFIFDRVSHQEAFTFGVAQRIKLLNNRPRGFRLELPLQILAQHRGGEQDITDLGVQTLSNTAIGLVAEWKRPTTHFNRFTTEGAFLLAYQQAGQLWPFNLGKAWWAGVEVQMLPQLQMKVGYFSAQNYVALYGAPFFSTLSLKATDGRFSHIRTIFYDLNYTTSLCKSFTLGAFVRGYVPHTGTQQLSDGTQQTPRWSNALSAGVFLRVNPSFFLKKL